MKVDGRTLRRDIKRFLQRNGLHGEFTVGSTWVKETIAREEPYLEVYFTDVTWDTCEAVLEYIRSEWWPQNWSKATIRYTDTFGNTCTRNYKDIQVVQGAFTL